IEVLVERVDPAAGPLAFAERLFAERRRGAIATVFATTRSEPIGERWCVDAATAFDGARAADVPRDLAEPCSRAMLSGKPSTEHVGPWTVLVEPIVPPLE